MLDRNGSSNSSMLAREIDDYKAREHKTRRDQRDVAFLQQRCSSFPQDYCKTPVSNTPCQFGTQSNLNNATYQLMCRLWAHSRRVRHRKIEPVRTGSQPGGVDTERVRIRYTWMFTDETRSPSIHVVWVIGAGAGSSIGTHLKARDCSREDFEGCQVWSSKRDKRVFCRSRRPTQQEEISITDLRQTRNIGKLPGYRLAGSMSAGLDIDPLDAYMDSIAGEVTQQATEPSTPSPSLPRPTSSPSPRRQPAASASPAQRAIAAKVSASPFCDVLTSIPRGAGNSWEHRTSGSGVADSASQPNGGAGGTRSSGGAGDASEACLRLLLVDPAEFLR